MPISTKVTASTFAVALSVLLIFILETTLSTDLPTPVEGAIGLVLVFGLGWLTPERHDLTKN